MTRTLPTYTPAQIADAINRARGSTGWPDGALIEDMAAFVLAGHQADDVLLRHAADQVANYLAQGAVEGRG